jgi:uncharacterized membrane protein
MQTGTTSGATDFWRTVSANAPAALLRVLRRRGFNKNKKRGTMLIFKIIAVTIFTGVNTMLGFNWFIAPVFGLDAINIIQALGLSTAVTYMTFHNYNQVKTEFKESTAWKIVFLCHMLFFKGVILLLEVCPC